jgi:indolepyruvate ferredoxin oxidoreductase
VAFQAGTIPLKAESIETAIRNSGVGVEQSLAAFRWGRMAVVDLAFVEAEVARSKGAAVISLKPAPQLSAGARAIVESIGAQGEVRRLAEVRVPELIAFQDEAYARRYAGVLKRVVAAEQGVLPGAMALSEAAARYLYKLMAYKDEYEVARLHTDPAFLAELDAQFPQGYSVKYNLAPPLLADTDPQTGHLLKKQYGPWMFKAFQRLAGWKKLRGGALDFFGKTEERSTERKLIDDYIRELDGIIGRLSVANHAAAVALASVPDEIRGYGHVKEKNLAKARLLQAERLAAFNAPVVLMERA